MHWRPAASGTDASANKNKESLLVVLRYLVIKNHIRVSYVLGLPLRRWPALFVLHHLFLSPQSSRDPAPLHETLVGVPKKIIDVVWPIQACLFKYGLVLYPLCQHSSYLQASVWLVGCLPRPVIGTT